MFCLLCASIAVAQVPPIVVSQTNWLSAFPNNARALSSGNVAGTSFAVNSSGEVLIGDSNSEVLIYNQQAGLTVLGTYQNVGAIAVDSKDNLYVASRASGYIVKVPYVNGKYAQLADPQPPGTPLPACSGADTTTCTWGSNLYYWDDNYGFGVVSMTFDSDGNFFFATNDAEGNIDTTNPNSHPFSIFECSVASSCLATADTGGGSGRAQRLFTEPAAVASNVPGCSTDPTQNPVQTRPGGLSVDPWGNLFFTDSDLESCGGSGALAYQSDASYLKEIASPSTLTSPATPVTLYKYIPSTISSYDSEVDSVAIDSTGTVYFATSYDGIFAFKGSPAPFTAPIPDQSIYGVSTTGTRGLALDFKGNLYAVEGLPGGAPLTDSVDTLGRVLVNSLAVSSSPVGTPASATNVSVMVNDSGCSSSPVLKFTGAGEFTLAATGSCQNSPLLWGTESIFAAKVTFTPTQVGGRSALLTATETSTGKSQPVTAYGVGQGGLVTLDQGNPPVTYTGFTNPAGISVDAAGDLFVADVGANAVARISAGSTTPVTIGSGFNAPSGTVLDAAGNLYVADTGNNQVVEIPTATGTPGSSATVISSSTKIAGMTLNAPTGLAMGDDGVLYISDTGNNRVVTYNTANGVTGVRATGLSTPGGIAVDTAGTLYVANVGSGSGGNVEVFPAGGGSVSPLTPSGVTTPIGLVVEPSGSLLISDGTTGAIVRIPNENGTLNAAGAVTVEKNPTSGGGLALDRAGNLYTTDPEGKSVYAIQRTGSTIDFGSVNDGDTAQVTVHAENAGNVQLGLGARERSFLTQPSTPYFSITAGMENDCLAASSLDIGAECQFTAEFSPTLGLASGSQPDSATFQSTAVDSIAVITLNGTSVYQPVPVPGFNVGLGSSSLVVKQGGSASMPVTITPENGFNSAVTFSCSGLPSGASCSFSPQSVTPSGGAVTSQLTVTFAKTSAGLDRQSLPFLPGGAAVCAVCFLFGLRKRRFALYLLLAVVTLGGLGLVSGCGVNVPPVPTKPTTVTVNAVSGALQKSATFVLTIQQ
ncbi:MAG: hypothetical protein ACRD3F_11580 [Acidobacteriaceae bacterium]